MIHRFGRFELRPDARLLLADGKPVEIGARAFDVLQALVERRDRVVTKDELLDLAWPGVIVEENNLQVQVSTLRKVLGSEAIKTIPGRGYRFALDVEPAPNAVMADSDSKGGAALPRPFTSFVGRERDLAKYSRLLADSRLVTLTGVGGCGKTRLAIELAKRSLSRFAQRVWFVDLAPVATSERMPQAAAAALGMREEGDRPMADAIAAFLGERPALLVLDNCEHLVEACARFVADVLGRTSQTTILATSRERLGVPGEQVALVRPLALAPAGADRQAREAAESVRLFVDRARFAAQEFELAPTMLPVVESICARLDGLPLAIELAAARVNVLSVEEIDARLGDRFRLLGGGKRSMPRHQTLRSVLDWSYELLEARDQRALRQLSVFVGGWTLAAAAAGIEASDDYETIETLSRLVDKSLVLAERGKSGQPRYRMLETVRAYAFERLEAHGEAPAARARHIEHFVRYAESQPKWRDADVAEGFARLDADLDNLLAAHDACDDQPDFAEAGLRLAGALGEFFRDRTHLRLGRAMIERALRRPGSPPRGLLRAKALAGAGDLAYELGDYEGSRDHFSEALDIASELGDVELQVVALRSLSCLKRDAGDLAQARVELGRALALARAKGLHRETANILGDFGETCRLEGDLDQAAAHYDEALAIYREHRLPHAAITLLVVSIVANERGDYARACACLREAVAETKAVRSRYLGWCVLQHAAALAATTGDAPFAARMWGALDAAGGSTGIALQRPDVAFLAARVERTRRALGEAAYAESHAQGEALSLEAATDEIDAWLERCLAASESPAAVGALLRS